MIHVLVSARKRYIFEEYFGHWGRDVAPCVRLHDYEALPDATSFPQGTWLFSDVDELNAAVLDLALSLRDTLVDAGMRVVNDPRAVLRRRPLLQALHERGMNDFRVFGLDDDLSDLRFPVFIRDASNHAGPRTPLLMTRAELDRWIARTWMWGSPADEMLAVEFLDTSDEHGVFRKYGAFIMDGRIVPRSLNRGTRWMVKHGTTDFNIDFQHEEVAYVRDNPHADTIADIARIANIDYGRIDYSVLNGRVQTWEINMCPTIGRGARPASGNMPDEIRELRQQAKELFYSAFADGWRSFDSACDGADLSAPFTTAQRHKAHAALRAAVRNDARPERLQLLRRILRPVKPVLQPVVDRTVSWMLSRR